MTVAELRDLLADLPDDMAVKVDHQPANQRIGIQDPTIGVFNINGTAYVNSRGVPSYAPTGEKYLIVE